MLVSARARALLWGEVQKNLTDFMGTKSGFVLSTFSLQHSTTTGKKHKEFGLALKELSIDSHSQNALRSIREGMIIKASTTF